MDVEAGANGLLELALSYLMGVSMGISLEPLMGALSRRLFPKRMEILTKQKIHEYLPLVLIKHSLLIQQVLDECALYGFLQSGYFRALGFDELGVGLGNEDGTNHFFPVHLNFPPMGIQFLFISLALFPPYPTLLIGKIQVIGQMNIGGRVAVHAVMETRHVAIQECVVSHRADDRKIQYQ